MHNEQHCSGLRELRAAGGAPKADLWGFALFCIMILAIVCFLKCYVCVLVFLWGSLSGNLTGASSKGVRIWARRAKRSLLRVRRGAV